MNQYGVILNTSEHINIPVIKNLCMCFLNTW